MKQTFNRLATLRQGALTAMLTLGTTYQVIAAQVADLKGGPAVNQLNFAPPATRIAEDQHWLHWFMLAICSVIFVAVFGVMFYSILKHRKSVGHKAQELPEPIWVELGWTIVPFFIVIGMALPATKVLVAQKDTSASDLTIKVTGMQWKWQYDYLIGEGSDINVLSTLDVEHRAMSNSGNPPPTDDYLLKVDNPLVVPQGKKVRLITTANDVIHSWMIPAFGVKQDAIPGMVRDTWFRAEQAGDFYGQCVELCGKEHAYMPIHVKVLPPEEYTAWVKQKKEAMAKAADDPNKVWELAELVKRGEGVYAGKCAACHQAHGKGGGAIKPLDGSAIVTDADTNKMLTIVMNGANNGAMPAWKADLSDTDIAAVMTFAKNQWSNQTGQVVQPSAVKAGR